MDNTTVIGLDKLDKDEVARNLNKLNLCALVVSRSRCFPTRFCVGRNEWEFIQDEGDGSDSDDSDYQTFLYCPAKSCCVSEYDCANCELETSRCGQELSGLLDRLPAAIVDLIIRAAHQMETRSRSAVQEG